MSSIFIKLLPFNNIQTNHLRTTQVMNFIKIIPARAMFQPSWLIVRKYLNKHIMLLHAHVCMHTHLHTNTSVYIVCIKSCSIFHWLYLISTMTGVQFYVPTQLLQSIPDTEDNIPHQACICSVGQGAMYMVW